MSAFAFNLVKMNGTIYGGVREPDYQRRDTFAPLGNDGVLHQTSNAVIRSAPMARWSTVAVKTFLAALNGSTDTFMKALNGTTGLELIGTKINTTGPGYDATAVHASRLAASGQVNLAGLSWSPGSPLVATLEAFFVAALGTTDPVASSAIALPTLPTNTEQAALGSLVIGGLTITRVTSFELAIAHGCENNADLCFNTGLPYPVLLQQAGVGGHTEFIATIDTLDLTGSITTSGTLVAIFYNINALGVGLSATALTITLNASLIREDNIAGQPGARRITVRATFDGTNKPMTVT